MLNYISTPVIKEKDAQHLVLESKRNKVWNPVFTIGVITFTSSMIFRGFLDADIAVIPLALSTLVLFSGIWILSENGMVIFDKEESNCYFIYKHLGYLQKIYVYPITSIDKVFLKAGGKTFSLKLLKDDEMNVSVAHSGNKELLLMAGAEIADFLKIPFENIA